MSFVYFPANTRIARRPHPDKDKSGSPWMVQCDQNLARSEMPRR
jgi:hypothetical protein